jgi:uncharacterized protein (TIGR02145 family)
MKKYYFLYVKHLPWLFLLFVCSNLFAQTTITLPTACSDCKSSSNGTAVVSSYGGAGCTGNAALNGTYTVGQAVTSANTMTLYANVTQIGTWNISTPANNGVTFSGSGTFTTTGCQSITLTAAGTPLTEGSLVAVTNTTPQGTATTTVKPVSNSSTNGTAVVTNYGNSTCATGSVGTINGTLTQAVAVSGVTMSLYANVTQIGSWSLSASQNGVTFTGSGTFTATGCQLITLTGAGTPTNTGSTTFTTNTTPSGSATATVVAAFNPSNFATASSGSISGKTCFDIALSNDNANSCGPLSSRASNKSDFSLSSVNTQTYTFTPSGTVSNVRFQYVNTNGQVITGITGGDAGSGITTAVTATVSYNSNLNTQALGLTSSNPLTANIYVIFNDGSSDQILKLTASVKDCNCCGAFVAAGVFKEFLCHNLGADISLDPNDVLQTNAWGLAGAHIQWGKRGPTGDSRITWKTAANDGPGGFAAAPTGSTLATANTASISGWNNNTVYSVNASWNSFAKTPKDPCPPGWRIPSKVEWEGVLANNTIFRTGTFTSAGQTPTSYGVATHFGPNSSTKLLTLPAAGHRGSDDSLTARAQYGFYWSSDEVSISASPAAYFVNTNFGSAAPNLPKVTTGGRNIGQSIRCIAE